nr:hypothetical protein [Agromyces marinus]
MSQPPRIERLEHHGVAPSCESPFPARGKNALRFEIRKVEELLQLERAEWPLLAIGGLVGVLRLVELGYHLSEDRPEPLAATLVPVIVRVASELQEQLDVRLVGTHGVVSTILDTAQVPEEVVSIRGSHSHGWLPANDAIRSTDRIRRWIVTNPKLRASC